jgi:serine/threonine protein phosphatase PrpC
MKLRVDVAALTDIGIVRHNNEDNFAFDTRLGVFVLCDGMGGQAAGEVASRLAIETVMSYFKEGERAAHFAQVGAVTADLSESALAVTSAIRLAHQAVREASNANAAHSGMGSTIVLARFQNQLVTIGHVGDSRAYLVRNGELRQLTMDHSLVMEQVRRGYMTAEQAEKSEMQNLLLRALGAEESAEPDVEDLAAGEGDLFVLLCDGIYKVIPTPQLKSILTSDLTPSDLARVLVHTAKENKSDDNLTCVLFRLVPRKLLTKPKHTSQSSL